MVSVRVKDIEKFVEDCISSRDFAEKLFYEDAPFLWKQRAIIKAMHRWPHDRTSIEELFDSCWTP